MESRYELTPGRFSPLDFNSLLYRSGQEVEKMSTTSVSLISRSKKVHRLHCFRLKISLYLRLLWRGGRAVEGARLESVCILTDTEGSNPSLSALSFHLF